MYKLNYKIIENINPNTNPEPQKTLFRGMHDIDYLEALSYPIQEGKIISFANFTSTSERREEAEEFLEGEDFNKFSILFEISVRQNKILFPLFYRIERSFIPNERECLFPPFTFFKVNNYTIDFNRKYLEIQLEAVGKREILELNLNERRRLIYDNEQNIITY